MFQLYLLKLILIKFDIFNITLLSEFLPLFFALIFFRKLQSKPMRVFFIYLIALSIFLLTSSFYKYYLQSATQYIALLKVYTIIEYSLICTFLIRILISSGLKKVVLISIPLFAALTIIVQFVIFPKAFNSWPLIIESLLLISFFVIFFYEKMKTVNTYPLSQSTIFWICVGFFIYFAGNFFFILFITYSKNKEFVSNQRIVYGIVTISKNIILSLAFLANEPTPKEHEALQVPEGVDLGDFTPTSFKN